MCGVLLLHCSVGNLLDELLGREPRLAKVHLREGDEVLHDHAQVAIELAGKAQARDYTAHGHAHQMIQVPVGGSR